MSRKGLVFSSFFNLSSSPRSRPKLSTLNGSFLIDVVVEDAAVSDDTSLILFLLSFLNSSISFSPLLHIVPGLQSVITRQGLPLSPTHPFLIHIKPDAHFTVSSPLSLQYAPMPPVITQAPTGAHDIGASH